jgi:DNA polymerase-1
MYVGYQATREKERQVSEDIWGQVEKLKVVFGKMKVPVFAVPGYEADDVIGSLSKQATDEHMMKQHDFHVIIITGDRDLMQLVDKQVVLYMPQKGLSDAVIVDEDKVMEKLGVHPSQVIDYKGLVGDSSDNYPGVAGIGPKTAVHLLAEYGSLEKIYKSVTTSPLAPLQNFGEGNKRGEVMPELLRKRLVEGHEAAMLSEKLATIKTDVPVTFRLNEAQVPTEKEMLEVLKELGYKSLVKRLGEKAEEDDDRQEKLFD